MEIKSIGTDNTAVKLTECSRFGLPPGLPASDSPEVWAAPHTQKNNLNSSGHVHDTAAKYDDGKIMSVKSYQSFNNVSVLKSNGTYKCYNG